MEKNEGRPIRVTEEQIDEIIKQHIEGADDAFDWVFDDIATNYLVAHPETPQQEEIEVIIKQTTPKTEQQRTTALFFLHNVVGLSDADLRNSVRETYATQNGYKILRDQKWTN